MDVVMVDKPFCLAVRAVVLDEQGKCLLLKRSLGSRHFAGTWEWPGGKPDKGESFDEAVLREVAEETGLEIKLTGVAGAYYFEMDQRHVAVLCMEAVPIGGNLCLSDEHEGSAWVPLDELHKWSLSEWFRVFTEMYAAKTGVGK